MIKPLAPRVLRGCSWTGLVLSFSLSLSLLLLPGLWTEAFAQTMPRPKGGERRQAQGRVPTPGQSATKPTSTVEVLKDPKAEKRLPLEMLKGVVGWRNVNESDVMGRQGDGHGRAAG